MAVLLSFFHTRSHPPSLITFVIVIVIVVVVVVVVVVVEWVPGDEDARAVGVATDDPLLVVVVVGRRRRRRGGGAVYAGPVVAREGEDVIEGLDGEVAEANGAAVVEEFGRAAEEEALDERPEGGVEACAERG